MKGKTDMEVADEWELHKIYTDGHLGIIEMQMVGSFF